MEKKLINLNTQINPKCQAKAVKHNSLKARELNNLKKKKKYKPEEETWAQLLIRRNQR